MARPLREGRGVKGSFLPFKNKNYFTLDNLLKYGHITLKFLSVGISSGLLQYFPKNRAILVQKLGAEKNCQNPFPAILWQKKSSLAIYPERGGGKALMARPLRKDYFCSFPCEVAGYCMYKYFAERNQE